MVDKNLQDFELAALDEWVELAKLVNEEASKNETKNDQYMLSNKCKYASSRDGNLRTHLKIHSGEKSNKCNQCDYACSDPSALGSHMKTHSGEKLRKCNQCDYASSDTSNLRRHLKTHNGENK